MLLTLSKPPKSEFEFRTYDYSPTFSLSKAARYSPKLNRGPLPSLPASAPSTMGTPHRGLPPPSAMTLPDPGRGPPPIPQQTGALPPPPSQWQGADEGMKNWLLAKAEEDRRKQEEERTRQESLRLEQRKIEQAMLRESMQGGVPPHLVPMIFAGIGGGNLASMSADWIQQYSAQLQNSHQQQQQQAPSGQSPELRRETRMIGQPPPGAYGQPQTPQSVLPPTSVLPGQPLPSQSQHAAFASTPYTSGNVSPRARAAQTGHVGAPTSAPRAPPQSPLPRLTTNEMHIQQPPVAPSSIQQLHQSQSVQQEQSSPSIYFHHWVPPNSQQDKGGSGNPPATPSGKYKASPSFPPRPRAASQASDLEYTSSPKKRKAQGGHQAPPPPTSAPQSYTSPSFSYVSTSTASTPARRGHARARSDASSRGAEASVSRRGTVSSYAHTEMGGTYPTDPAEHRFSQPRRPPDAQQHQQQQQDQAYANPTQRNDGRGNGQQARAGTPMSIDTETRQSGSHHQFGSNDRGSVPTSPKREVGGQ
ncbi:hypothetical protein BDV95DRAFT_613698 [Massariosphaeria phaeospora]|uniref:Uncharacterized protein n=1 Tax=Massariosphaeria phaeospora TaxID=100035 RepID=A0A7C8IIJ8_9PLEO|nr:hypothetical protein BDV95DRAFT_613698 [Massariosphaeria phaeospora]